MRRTFILLTLLFCASVVTAQVRLPKIFGDHMVLQREQPIAIWGWSSPGERITVQLDKHIERVRADKDGRWKLMLDPMQAGGPFQLIVKGKNTVTFNDVLIGEVWICSGQSNMAWTVQRSENADNEIANAKYPTIRHIKIPNTIAAEPRDDIEDTSWKICTPENVPDFTAVGYFFAREVMKEINVPIGLINSSWGGTQVEPWTSREAFEGSDEFRDMIAAVGRIDLDSVKRKNEKAIVKNIERLQGPLSQSLPDTVAWKELSFKDDSWPQMAIPGFWERKAVGNVDGVIWFRKTINIEGRYAGKESILHLGRIDDFDETYVNGVKVGSMSHPLASRVYTIPAGIIRDGKNVIAVRVTDAKGNGGIGGEPDGVWINIGGADLSLAGDWSYQVESITKVNGNVSPNQFPSLLFNAMINPLIPYTIRGAVWYQGEGNAGRAHQYREAFPLMIKDWRKRWRLGDFPFYFVQLATYNANNGNSNAGSAWAELREAQTLTLALPNTGMAVTTDIGNPGDIHPRNKQDVGRRLAAIALHDVYKKDVVSRGPAYSSMRKEGNKIILSFTDTGSGLVIRDKYGYLKGFEIAGADRKFRYAKAHIEGNNIVVYHEDILDPVAVRYGWADDASDCNLYNKEGFPAGPFRTDKWKGITEGKKLSVAPAMQ